MNLPRNRRPQLLSIQRFAPTRLTWVLVLGGAMGAAGCSDGGGSNGTTGGAPAVGGASGGMGSGGTASGGVASGGAATGGASSGGAATGGAGAAEVGGSGGSGAGGSGGATVEALPELLSETGLYADIAADQIAADVQPFAPQFTLWTDTATKMRWIHLPEGQQIDTTDMDNWTYPVGTKLWKEFSRDGVRVETRLLMRTREGGRGWKGVAYIWNDEQTDAVAAPEGMENAKGTPHDVPPEGLCRDCHGDRDDWPLGFGAVQLSYDSELLDMDDLIAAQLLTAPPSQPIVVPGTEEEKAVAGYLHANCGSCHREAASGTERSNLALWLEVDQLASFQETDVYTNLVNQKSDFIESALEYRVYGGQPDQSELYRRMVLRGDDAQMPRVGTEDVDPTGEALIKAWIESLPPPVE